ncbi:MAG: polysaccharide biosynthesis protein [Bacteroidales bacterium]|nr:polysaccharide biosynthesis protein [Bacteroidales bacterium]
MRILNYFKSKYMHAWFILLCDIIVSLAASLLVILGVEFFTGVHYYTPRFVQIYLVTSLAVSVVLFLVTRIYKIIIRHISMRDLLQFAFMAVFKALGILAVMAVAGLYSKWLLLVVILDMLVTGALLLSLRLILVIVYHLLLDYDSRHSHLQRVLVYGTGDKSVATIKRLQSSPHYKVVGFIERGDGPLKSHILEQLPVFHFENEHRLDKISSKEKVDAVLFSRDTDAQNEEEGLIKYCVENGVKTLIVPNVEDVEEGQPLLRPREVNVEDLLGREEIKISLDKIKSEFAGKVVMVTGAAGSIGSELVRQLATFGVKQIVLYDNAETPMHNIRLELEDNFKNLDFVPVIGSVRHPERLDYAFRKWRPQIVFHAAAYKHVPLMEENPCESVLANVYGTRNVADKCLEYDVEKMVMISTDKAVNPTNIMGCTKRLAEIYVQSLGLAVQSGKVPGKTRFVTTRFGNVLGSNGSVIPRFRQQIAHGGPVTVTHPDINRFFMTIPEACRLVMEAATMSTGNNIFVFDMGKAVKIDQLARRMITLAGFTPDKDIKIEYTGLRPGEKLYEEVLSNEENTLPSFHERIRVAKVREYDYEDALRFAKELEELAREVNIPDMVRLMKKIVPEYKSENSRFAALDKEENK